MSAAAFTALVVAAAVGSLRWLRVAQREHYLAGSTTRFAWRWWKSRPVNALLFASSLGGAVAVVGTPLAGLVTSVACLAGPIGLGLHGRTSPLRWTRRLATLAAASGVLVAGIMGGVYAAEGDSKDLVFAAAINAALLPLVIDFALAVMSPIEKLVARRYVREATEKLKRIGPQVVAITGSYGKTSTKNYVEHLLSGRCSVVASPASFNNTAGLSRAVNEKLGLGTEVFIAEMGTYGPGEIASMCEWIVPDIAVITAIGPVHIERMKTENRILAAKAEICDKAKTVVLNVDDPRLSGLADRLESSGKIVLRASVDLLPPGFSAGGVSATNLACAWQVVRCLGVDDAEVLQRLGTLPGVANRRTTYRSDGGFTVIDDTYNSNPAGARAALDMLSVSGEPGGRKVVVTPGMVELGRVQVAENASFAGQCVSMGAILVVVGRTNRSALLEGIRESPPTRSAAGDPDSEGPDPRGQGNRMGWTVTVATRPEAVAWVRDSLGEGDAVLYENDLPDHYP